MAENKKKTIVILTSSDEPIGTSSYLMKLLKTEDNKVVIISEDKYKATSEFLFIADKIKNNKYYSKELAFLERKKLFKFVKHTTIKRISNMIYRYQPELLVTVTPFAHYVATRAKQYFKSDVKIVNYIFRFVLEDRVFNDYITNCYIVENTQMREELINQGVKSINIANLGFPFTLEKISDSEIEEIKRRKGIPESPIVCIDLRDNESLKDVFSMLVDQGNIFNLIIRSYKNNYLDDLYKKLAGLNINVIFSSEIDEFDKYLSFADVLITDFNVVTIYKSFSVSVPIIGISKDYDSYNNLKNLADQGLILATNDNVKVISYLYDITQTGIKDLLIKNSQNKMKFVIPENIKNFLLTVGEA